MAKPRGNPAIDLSLPGAYLVTAVTAARRPVLARLVPETSRASRIGECVTDAWHQIQHHCPWVTLGEFVVMPDHMHGILSWERVPGNRRATISALMSQFKSEATRRARSARALSKTTTLWQRGFHVHRLMTDSHLQRATQYVIDNPGRAWLKLCQQHGTEPGWDPAARTPRALSINPAHPPRA